jgi:hypothetical protein
MIMIQAEKQEKKRERENPSLILTMLSVEVGNELIQAT